MEENITILKWILATVIACWVFAIIGGIFNDKNISIKAEGIQTPMPSGARNQIAPVKVIEPKLSPIEADIKTVFGKYYPKAILLLKGKGGSSCAENRSLNPDKVYDDEVNGGVGKDYGVFQINDKWQGVSNTAFLKDPAINIRMAWRIFENDGYSFRLWTCGRAYGI